MGLKGEMKTFVAGGTGNTLKSDQNGIESSLVYLAYDIPDGG